MKRPQGGNCDVGAYEVRVRTFSYTSSYDGWVNGNSGVDSTADTLRVGDDAHKFHYQGLLSFDTGALPDGASLVMASLQVKQQGVSGDPWSSHGSLPTDLQNGYFGDALGLGADDFNASASASPAGSLGPTLSNGFYSVVLNGMGLLNISKTATTQLRLAFSLAGAGNRAADYLSLYSGEARLADRPQLVVYYNR